MSARRPTRSAPAAAASPREPVRLRARRIYILPTRHGLLFAVTLLIMLVGSINYNSSLGHAVTFLLVGIALAAMVQTHRNLAGLRLRGARAAAVFAGDTARFPVRIEADGPDRTAIAVQSPGGPPSIGDVTAGDGHENRLMVRRSTQARGRLASGPVRVSTEYPLALFRAWSWVEWDGDCLVYPRPEAGTVPAPQSAVREDGARQGTAPGMDDFQGLRGYRPGDSPRHIAWKRLPMNQEPTTKQFDGSGSAEIWLDWEQLQGLEAERRLSRLCRWVLDSDVRGLHYGLRLPGKLIEPGSGPAHKRRCLEALALLRLPTRRAS